MNRLQRRLEANKGVPLLGVAAYFYDPVFLEISARLGYQAAWIEMEHGPMSFGQAVDLVRIAQGLGMLTMIRVADCRRESILKAAECGPDIIDVPMVNTPEVVAELVSQARFAPEGERGFFSVSRALHYGIVDNLTDAQRQLNDELCLMIQIETREAFERADELCAVDGVDIFVGPADLSASLGYPGNQGHPAVRQAAEKIVSTARRHGKCVATAGRAVDFDFWLGLNVDILFATNDISALRHGAEHALGLARASLDRVRTVTAGSSVTAGGSGSAGSATDRTDHTDRTGRKDPA
jgi:2-keto-3-deoxy-L-rhamnonate aldolase RhmA